MTLYNYFKIKTSNEYQDYYDKYVCFVFERTKNVLDCSE